MSAWYLKSFLVFQIVRVFFFWWRWSAGNIYANISNSEVISLASKISDKNHSTCIKINSQHCQKYPFVLSMGPLLLDTVTTNVSSVDFHMSHDKMLLFSNFGGCLKFCHIRTISVCYNLSLHKISCPLFSFPCISFYWNCFIHSNGVSLSIFYALTISTSLFSCFII